MDPNIYMTILVLNEPENKGNKQGFLQPPDLQYLSFTAGCSFISFPGFTFFGGREYYLTGEDAIKDRVETKKRLVVWF